MKVDPNAPSMVTKKGVDIYGGVWGDTISNIPVRLELAGRIMASMDYSDKKLDIDLCCVTSMNAADKLIAYHNKTSGG